MSLYKDVFQKEQHSDCSLKKHHQKEPRSFRSHIKEFGYSSQLCLSQSAEIIYKKVMSYEHIARNKKLITFHKSRFANMSLSSRVELLKCLLKYVNQGRYKFIYS
ncbi:uncharacterized protein LOC143189927 isoform X2 [Rhynchophorus ferrugineus]|uniref:uncharacterized protein LOC143189927 isoform X2 n=1 Tax=Rhynchophorus ferrugineus TaxID=354439 RepID=UPI003FCD89C1